MKVIRRRKKRGKLKFIIMFIFLSSLLLSGIVVADKNTRAIGFGDYSSIFVLNEYENERREIEINVMGKQFKSDINAKLFFDFFMNK